MFDKLARHSDLMNQMARKVGVSLGEAVVAGDLGPEALRGAVFRCTQCANVAECEAFLADSEVSAADVPDYCLNRWMISGLQSDDG